MIWGYLIICLLYLVLIIWSRKVKCDTSTVSVTFLRPFYRISYQLYHTILRCCQQKARKLPAIMASKKVRGDLNTLKPTDNAGRQEQQFYIEKLSMVFLILCLGTVLGLCSTVSSLTSGVLQGQDRIQRNTYGGGTRAVSLLASVGEEGEEGSKESVIVGITAKVGEQQYTYDEFLEKAEEMLMEFPELILNGNPSLQEIGGDLKLIESVKGYPFELKWESSEDAVLHNNGKIDFDNVEEGRDITLYLTVSYRNFELQKKTEIHLLGIEERLTQEELLSQRIEEAIAEQDRITGEENTLTLPTEVGGERIVWTEPRENNGPALLLLALLAGLVYYFWRDHELHEKVERRGEALILAYPEMISKLTLLLSAGLTMRGAWFRLAEEYQKKKKEGKQESADYIYEEMLVTCHEMEEGVSELKAYSNFGKRCNNRRYLRFSAIITQNLKRGSDRLLTLLAQEAEDTFEERKNYARKRGEEAGTKLLIPMMLMLVIVMVVIMVPAFISFA